MSSIPSLFHNFLMPVKNIHSYNTRHAARCNFYRPKIRTNFGKFTFKYSASVLWESITVSLLSFQLKCSLLSFQLKCSSNIDSIHYLGLTNSFDQVPRNIHTLPSIIVNFLLNSLNAPITFVVCATNQS